VSTLNLTQLEAPVAYTDVRSRLNTMRGIFGLVLASMAVTGVIDGLEPAPWVLVLGGYLVGDAVWRRKRGTSAVPMLTTDIVVFSVLAIVRDDPGLIESSAFFYILTGAMLLLRIPAAVAVVGAAIAVGIPASLIRPINDPNVGSLRQGIVDIVVVAAIAGLMATLLYGAVQALNAATVRHQTALNAERRAVELKDEFVSMVSHEFRTPLTSIAGFSETLRASWADLSQEEIEEFLIIMRQEAHHLSNLVEDILVIPRIEAGRLRLRHQEFDLAAEVAATSRLVFADTGKEVNASIPGGVMVNADRGRVGQVLRNLMDNARKYGGDSVEINGDAATDIYTISVSDNGPGIVEEDWERVFEHFEQGTKGDARSGEGVGLGLPIARQLARAMGGDVWYVPRFPTGASFQFSMPLSRIIPEAGAAAPSPQPSEADNTLGSESAAGGSAISPSAEPSAS
jgi:signal transduction histidine kinase